MGAFGPLDIVDLLREEPRAAEQTPSRTERPAAQRRPDKGPKKRWWFSFDGWRGADLEAEYVLA